MIIKGLSLTACLSAVLTLLLFSLSSCHSVDDQRIPALPVNIRLTDTGLWNSYGVAAFGSYRTFILADGIREPRSFPYTQTSATGFGGILLISGMDPYTTATDCPLAYDLACPVEREAEVRVRVIPETYIAKCEKCGSTFDVTMGGGTPLSGPAASKENPYGMRRYQCIPSGNGGYFITN